MGSTVDSVTVRCIHSRRIKHSIEIRKRVPRLPLRLRVQRHLCGTRMRMKVQLRQHGPAARQQRWWRRHEPRAERRCNGTVYRTCASGQHSRHNCLSPNGEPVDRLFEVHRLLQRRCIRCQSSSREHARPAADGAVRSNTVSGSDKHQLLPPHTPRQLHTLSSFNVRRRCRPRDNDVCALELVSLPFAHIYNTRRRSRTHIAG